MSLPSCHVIGDSISIQYGPYLEAALAGSWDYSRKAGDEEARKNLDIPVGANGGDSSQVLAFLSPWAENISAPLFDVMMINCGLHDIKRCKKTDVYQVSIDDYATNLKAIVEVTGRIAHKMIWMRTTPVDDERHAGRTKFGFHRFQADVDRYNAVADQVMTEAGVTIIDLAKFTADCLLPEDVRRFTDGVHFSPTVQAQQGAWLAGLLMGSKTT